MANWEDELIGDTAGNADETPIYTQLYLEYREAMFRRIGFKLQQELHTEESPGESPGEEQQEES
jgi:hypothetical protein